MDKEMAQKVSKVMINEVLPRHKKTGIAMEVLPRGLISALIMMKDEGTITHIQLRKALDYYFLL